MCCHLTNTIQKHFCWCYIHPRFVGSTTPKSLENITKKRQLLPDRINPIDQKCLPCSKPTHFCCFGEFQNLASVWFIWHWFTHSCQAFGENWWRGNDQMQVPQVRTTETNPLKILQGHQTDPIFRIYVKMSKSDHYNIDVKLISYIF